MYKSPIELLQVDPDIIGKKVNEMVREMVDEQERYIYRGIMATGIHVDKDELIKALMYDRNQYNAGYKDGVASVEKHGKWVEYELDETYGSDDSNTWYKCSECQKGAHGWVDEDTWYSFPHLSDYCPHCGTKMDGGKDDA